MCSAIFLRITDIGSTRELSPEAKDGCCAAGAGTFAADAGADAGAERPLRPLHVREDVVLGDAARDARPFDLSDVDLVFFGHLADERRGAGAAPLFERARRFRSLRRRGGGRGTRRGRFRRRRRGGLRPGRFLLRRLRFGRGRGLGRLRRGRGGAAASPSVARRATTLLTATVSPSFARISVRVPAAGEGISASTLSVEISKSGSSRSTRSPTFLIHRITVPSAIDSPICGITTSVAIILRSFQPFRFRRYPLIVDRPSCHPERSEGSGRGCGAQTVGYRTARPPGSLATLGMTSRP